MMFKVDEAEYGGKETIPCLQDYLVQGSDLTLKQGESKRASS